MRFYWIYYFYSISNFLENQRTFTDTHYIVQSLLNDLVLSQNCVNYSSSSAKSESYGRQKRPTVQNKMLHAGGCYLSLFIQRTINTKETLRKREFVWELSAGQNTPCIPFGRRIHHLHLSLFFCYFAGAPATSIKFLSAAAIFR